MAEILLNDKPQKIVPKMGTKNKGGRMQVERAGATMITQNEEANLDLRIN